MKTTGKKYTAFIITFVVFLGIAFFVPTIHPTILSSKNVAANPAASVLDGSCICNPINIQNKSDIKPQLLSKNSSTDIKLPYLPVFTDINKPQSKKIFRINSQKYGGLGGALKKYSFVGKVGGVAFESIAIPDDSIKNKSISIKYNKSNPDGCRFSVIVDGSTFRFFVPDWLLIPAANYSNSSDTALVSLFGPESTKTSYDIVYHESMVDTLLGIRILQADMLFMGLTPSELFQADGKDLLGFGEKGISESDKEKSKLFLEGIKKEMANANLRSWVLTDYNISVTFGADIATSSFYISGYPYYYFWNVEKNVADIERIIKTLTSEQQEAIFDFLSQVQIDPSISPPDDLKELLIDINTTVIPITELTELFKKNRNSIRALNPIVTDAATQLMRLAAFFRYIKDSNPLNWNTFLSDIRSIIPEPQIVSPTRLEKSILQ